jgi:radical SAM superfamily enzyme YgiQ (UPF0313 family)
LKVLFSNPPWWTGNQFKYGFIPMRLAGVRAGSRWPFTYPTFSFPGWRMPFEYLPLPLFMGYAASFLQRETGAEVVLRDSIARRESCRRYFDFIDQQRFDYIFIETATPSWEHDRKLITELHRRQPRLKIVICGPIAAEKAEEIIAACPVTACIRGEYDKNSVKAARGQTGVIDYDFLTDEEMNAAPAPMCDENVIRSYYDRNPRGIKLPNLQVWASRGCPFKCIFCVWPATMTGCDPDGKGKRLVRYYTPAHLEPYIRARTARFGFRSIYFDDDTFNLGARHTLEICAMMKRIGLPWSAMCRTDTIEMGVWEEMKKAGCYGVKLGFESGNQEVVDKIVNKHLDLKKAREVVLHLKKLGLTVHGTFTIGLPGETGEQMKETVFFAESLPLDSKQISGAAEIEGTPLHHLRKHGRLRTLRTRPLTSNTCRPRTAAKNGSN